MRIIRFLLYVFIITLVSCQNSSVYKLLKQGQAQEEDFFETIPFEMRAGVPVIEMEVNGVKGWFLFDTGAPNVLAKGFAEKLDLEVLTKGKINDSGGHTTSGNPYVRLDDVKVGSTHFYNTAAIVMDLRATDVFKCLEFDGIIGANIMRHAYWKIDYKNQQFIYTSDIEKLELDETYQGISFKTKTSGTPVVDIEFDGVKVTNITFDTGSSGHISVPQKAVEKIEETQKVEKAYSIGATSFGVGGKAKTDTAFFAIIDSIKMGDLFLENKVVEFEKYSDNMGNAFFKNYDVILDWKTQKIYMRKLSEYDFEKLNTFGFGVIMQNGNLEIGSIYNNTDSEKFLKGGDQVLKMNDYDFTSGDFSELCNLIKKEGFKFIKGDSLDIAVKRGGEELNFHLNKTVLLD